jgi:hypothetical protein
LRSLFIPQLAPDFSGSRVSATRAATSYASVTGILPMRCCHSRGA